MPKTERSESALMFERTASDFQRGLVCLVTSLILDLTKHVFHANQTQIEVNEIHIIHQSIPMHLQDHLFLAKWFSFISMVSKPSPK